jgi:integrase
MTPDQAVAIHDSVAGSDLEPPVTLAMFTGLRLSEVLGLHWGDDDLPGHLDTRLGNGPGGCSATPPSPPPPTSTRASSTR